MPVEGDGIVESASLVLVKARDGDEIDGRMLLSVPDSAKVACGLGDRPLEICEVCVFGLDVEVKLDEMGPV